MNTFLLIYVKTAVTDLYLSEIFLNHYRLIHLSNNFITR